MADRSSSIHDWKRHFEEASFGADPTHRDADVMPLFAVAQEPPLTRAERIGIGIGLAGLALGVVSLTVSQQNRR